MNIDLTGKRAIVCGSSQGIGKAIAVELSQLGAHITLFARNKTSLENVKQELNVSKGQDHHVLIADFSDTKAVKSNIQDYVNKVRSIHILVNNTGGPAPGLAIDEDPEKFRLAFDQHLINNQILVQTLVPLMKQEQYGRIINVISTSVKAPIQGLGVSNTIRGAVASWAKTLSNELGEFGITVNNILPGLTQTDRLNNLIKKKANDADLSVEDMTHKMKTAIPLKRFADPTETAALAGFLASPAASYITGTSIRVDGGSTPSI